MIVVSKLLKSNKPPLVIEAPARVLFIDDQKIRLDAIYESGVLKTKATYANSALAGIDQITDHGPWDVIFLDHDLDTHVQEPYPHEITGRDVATILGRMNWHPQIVIVHSMNSVGSTNIINVLNDAGIQSIRMPISMLANFEEIHDCDSPPPDDDWREDWKIN